MLDPPARTRQAVSSETSIRYVFSPWNLISVRLLSRSRGSSRMVGIWGAKRSSQEGEDCTLPCPKSVTSVRILRQDSNSSIKLGPLRGTLSGNALYKPLQRREKPLLSSISRLGVSPNSTMVGNTPKIPPQRPRLQANTCGRIRPQADWRGSISTIRIRDLGRISGPMRTQANLCGRSFLVAEAEHIANL